MHANAAYLAATMQTRRDYCSLRTIRKATAMTPAEVDNALLALTRAGMVEITDVGRWYRYKIKFGLEAQHAR